MLHPEYKEKFRDKKIGILGQGHIGYSLWKLLEAERESLNLTLETFNRQNLRTVKDHRFDYFFDCAGTTGDYRAKILKTVEANTSLPVFLLRNLNVSESLTVLSSSRIYGFHDNRNRLIDEEFRFSSPHLSLDFIYDGSKQLMESLFFNYQKQVPYKIQLIRLSNVYGRFKRSQIDDSTYLKVMINHYLNKTPIIVRHHPEGSKDYIFIDDALEGILRAAALSFKTDYFNIASGRSFTIREWIAFLNLEASYDTPGTAPMHCSLSIEKAQRTLGFRPKASLHGLSELVSD